MKDIDRFVIAVLAYVVFAGLFSFLYSYFSSVASQTVKEPVVKDEPQVVVPGKGKKQKLINPGYEALCNVCDRRFENDTYLKNHLDGQKHVKKALNFEGEVYKIVKVQPQKKK